MVNQNSGERLVAPGAIATEINEAGQVCYVHPNLHSSVAWIDPGNRPPGTSKGDAADLYYVWTPSRGYYHARKLNG